MRRLAAGAARMRQVLDDERDTRVSLAVRAGKRYLADDMPDRAASLAYYGLLSLFPSLLILFAAIGLVAGNDAPSNVADWASEHGASGAISDALRSVVTTAANASPSGAGVIGALGIGTFLYGSSKGLTAAGRAFDAVGGRPRRGRSPLRRLQDVGWTLVLIAMGILSVALVVVSGRLLEEVLDLIGLSGAAVTVATIVRWPVAVILLLFAVAVVRWAAPASRRGRFRLVTPGSLVAVAVWLAATAGYAIYVSYLSSYNDTYGAFTGAVILLLWLWLGAAALLYGAELDAVLRERGRG